ncbi:MAG: HAMP domain-containing protein [Treponemataceae bacterium]|nr:HAMP domain-containing protein [Treponemataceae bacterium]
MAEKTSSEETKKKFGLAIKMASLFSLVIIILIVGMNFAIVRDVRSSITEIYSQNVRNLAMGSVNHIAEALRLYQENIRSYAKSEIVRTGDEAAIIEWMQANPQFQHSDYDYEFFAGRNAITHRVTGEIGADISDRVYYSSIVNGGKTDYIGDPIVSRTSGKFVVPVATAAVDSSGKTFGIFNAMVNIDKINKIVKESTLGTEGYAILLDSKGVILSHPNPELVKTTMEGWEGISQGAKRGGINVSMQKTPVGENLMAITTVPETPGWIYMMAITGEEINVVPDSVRKFITILGVFVGLVLMIIAYIILSRTVKMIKVVTSTVKDIATGDADLTRRIEIQKKDEIGHLINTFNSFVKKLQDIISSIKNSKNTLENADEDLQHSIEDTASAITEILANIEGIGKQVLNQSSSVSETAGAVTQISQNIDSLEKMIENQSSSVTEASAAVEEMMGNISSVNTSVEKMASEFSALEKDTQTGIEKQNSVKERIDEIAEQSAMLIEANTAIESIASQTNMLAMNAAIEAAHAGDAGKGFSVVADEIRKLSETSTEQSHTIGDELRKIVQSIEVMVNSSNESEEAFSAVGTRIKNTDVLVRQIKSAMDEQNEGSKQIFEALQSLNDNTSEVRSAAVEMTEGNKSIISEVRKLQDATEVIKESMSEMTSGAKEINQCGAVLADISRKVNDSVHQIGSEIDLFKV